MMQTMSDEGKKRQEGKIGWPVRWKRRNKPCLRIRIDSEGEIPGIEQAEAAAATGRMDVCLVLSPGMVLLRRVDAEGLDAKTLEASLWLKAEETLPAGLDDFYLDTWSIAQGAMGLAALPRKPLQRARQQIAHRIGPVTRVLVPELHTPNDARTGVRFWTTSSGLVACVWDGLRLVHWQAFPGKLPFEAVVDLTAALLPKPPKWMALDEHAAAVAALRTSLSETWSDVQFLTTDAGEEDMQEGTDAAMSFEAFLREEEMQAASGIDKWRLGLMLSGAVVSGLFLLFAEVQHLERKVARMQHQVSLLKVKANRSGQVAMRIGHSRRELDELRAMTVERRGVLYLLRALSDALPAQAKLVVIGVERSGSVAVEGVVTTELDITLFLGELGRSAVFKDPRLTFTQKEERTQAEPLVRFRIEMHLSTPLLRLPEASEGA